MKQLHLGVEPPSATSARDIGEPEEGDRWMKPVSWDDVFTAPDTLVAHHEGWHPVQVLAFFNAKKGRSGFWVGDQAPRVQVVDLITGDMYEVDQLDCMRIPRTETVREDGLRLG